MPAPTPRQQNTCARLCNEAEAARRKAEALADPTARKLAFLDAIEAYTIARLHVGRCYGSERRYAWTCGIEVMKKELDR